MASINDEIWNQGNLELIDERYAEDYVRHEAGYPAESQGSAGLKQFIEALRVGFPDWNCAIEETLAVGDKVVVRYRCTGTQTGEWNGLAPTGKQIEFTDNHHSQDRRRQGGRGLVGVRLAGLDAAAWLPVDAAGQAASWRRCNPPCW
jgi:predicted ester cyclase